MSVHLTPGEIVRVQADEDRAPSKQNYSRLLRMRSCFQSRHQGLAEARNSGSHISGSGIYSGFGAKRSADLLPTRCWRRSRAGIWPGLSFVLSALSHSWQGLSAPGLARREG